MTPRSILDRFLQQPRRFRFDAAVRLLMHFRKQGDPARIGRFRTSANLSYPAADIVSVTKIEEHSPGDVTIGIGGLTGPSGVLPRYYTEQVMQQVRIGAHGLHLFLDTMGHRMVAAFAQAGMKYRPHRAAEQHALGGSADRHRAALLALVGEAEPTAGRERDQQDVILQHAGLFAAWPRSAERLEAILSDYAGRRVTVEQFVGSWLNIPEPERTRLPKARDTGRFARLGVDAAIGTRAWDPQSKVLLRIEPMPLAAFQDFMPQQPMARQIVELARSYLGPSAVFSVIPALVGEEVPPLQLSPTRRLGWDTWLPKQGRGDATDAVISAKLVERLDPRARAA